MYAADTETSQRKKELGQGAREWSIVICMEDA